MTPHTEPESLAAWVRRTAPTLTDEQWAAVWGWATPGGTCPAPVPGWERGASQRDNITAARALLAELDRIAGELTEAQLDELRAIDAGDTSMPYTIARSLGALLSIAFHGHAFDGEHRAACNVTPLGRAVLARKAAQR